MDFRLKVFQSVAKNLSFTKASQELFVSQPAITKHIQETRIEKAITLLTTTDLSIQEISESVGINDLSWFSKLFKKIVGVSPTQYRATKFS